MQTKRRYGTGGFNGPTGGPFMLMLGALAFIIIFAGYYFGSHVQLKKAAPVTAESHFRENTIRQEIDQCYAAINELRRGKESLLSGVGDIRTEVSSLQKKSSELFARHEAFEKEAAECTQKAELERKAFNEETAKQAEVINAEKARLDALREELDAITDGRGTRMTLDIQALKSMRKLNLALRSALQIDLPIGPDTLPTIEAELLTKWGAYLDNEDFFSEQGRRTELSAFVKNWEKWTYDSTIHTDIITTLTRGVDDNVERVTWNGYVMRPVAGYDDENKRPTLPSGTLADALVEMYDVALCSYRRNATRISYPSTFYAYPSLERTQLAAIVDAPVVNLCYQCPDPKNTSEFALACGGSDSALRLYGSYAFWSMRSLFRFTQEVYNAADAFMEKHGLEEGAFTAVVNHVSEAAKRKCDAHERINYGPHRLWLEHMYGLETIRHLNDDREEQCEPSETDVRSAIISFGKAEGGGDNNDDNNGDRAPRVYMSAPDLATDQIDTDNQFRISSYEVHNAFDEAVDMVIASRAKSIVVSPFFRHSQIVTELFLLRNGLRATGIVFF